jgi:putative heme-binding domain-containing protein
MRFCMGIFLAALLAPAPLLADEARDQLIVETVLKLEGFNYQSASDKVKAAIGRYLARTPGSEEYFQLVEKFRVEAELSSLAKLASAEKANPRAAGLLVAIGGEPAIKSALADAGSKRSRLLMSLGTVNDPRPVATLVSLLTGRDPVESRASAKALGGSPAGQLRLLELAEEGSLPDKLKPGVSMALSSSVDPAIRSRVAKVLPSPASLGGESLPPLADLVKLRGDPKKGQLVYMRACFTCHKVGEKGIDFGPALTEIGDKLAREALYTAIIDPNEAISFGYEGVSIEAEDGRKLIGYVASDGEQEVGVKVPGGALVTVKAGEIKVRESLPVSLMPATLVATMSRNDLVNLVEYLITLKK